MKENYESVEDPNEASTSDIHEKEQEQPVSWCFECFDYNSMSLTKELIR